jgi:hypothetical protein
MSGSLIRLVVVGCCNHHGLGALLFGWLDILLLWSTQWGGQENMWL